MLTRKRQGADAADSVNLPPAAKRRRSALPTPPSRSQSLPQWRSRTASPAVESPESTAVWAGFKPLALSPANSTAMPYSPYDPEFGDKVCAQMRVHLDKDLSILSVRTLRYGKEIAENYREGMTPAEVRDAHYERQMRILQRLDDGESVSDLTDSEYLDDEYTEDAPTAALPTNLPFPLLAEAPWPDNPHPAT